MIWRILGLALAAMMGAILLYLSPFWPFELWDNEGLFGIKGLRPGGDLLSWWLRGTLVAPFDILMWVAIVFLSLTWLQGGLDRLKAR